MSRAPFGNDPAKIERYQAFWRCDPASRPLVGFSTTGWFPMGEFAACKSWGAADYLTPDMVDTQAFVRDHLRILQEGEIVEDDLIRGACPGQVTIPWLPAILGCRLRILPQNVLGEERCRPWNEVRGVRLDTGSAWFRKYAEMLDALVTAADGRFPVSHTAELGPTDLHAVLRGHSGSIFDLTDDPEEASALLDALGGICRDFTEQTWKRLPLFHGGWFDAQYSLWSPRPIIRMQEDATAVFSPALYRRFVQPVDRKLARHFSGCFIHLHSTSMFLLDGFLEIGEIQCFEVNNDAAGPPVAEMVPYFQRIQSARKPLLIRGSFTPDELRLLRDSLDPSGLFLNIMVSGLQEIDLLKPLAGM